REATRLIEQGARALHELAERRAERLDLFAVARRTERDRVGVGARRAERSGEALERPDRPAAQPEAEHEPRPRAEGDRAEGRERIEKVQARNVARLRGDEHPRAVRPSAGAHPPPD